ncbi:RagB/SusD family nutrient uptake outer membrane protein [Mucilaginibacter sp. E4BP6]|uniref:RagB/SusD family nutrient uptake outer membrane protein n=1 Tax=Mucilaginibacter sp. E4BP6 TaxID=2723089 RepID=UPI0015CC7E5A|nr:RagB/SusD family nutrient uptake outer membrane protein [Mucilaginibacter sp. E4BP6]NYE64927.1 hypothetical protein [Mucilaginibacter sp. E4BP6]
MKTLKKRIISRLLFGGFLLIGFSPSCKKQNDFLNVKSVKSNVTPATLTDFQAVLDNTVEMNENGPIEGLIGTDNIYFTDVNLNAVDATSKNSYLWAKDLFQGSPSPDWSNPYQTIEYANIVLDGLSNLPAAETNSPSYNNVKGSALFYRSFAFYLLSQLFCKPYIKATATTDLGIPLRLSSAISSKSTRATVQQTYDQIINDLQLGATLLPQTPLYKTRPSSVAANALLAKVYLSMSDYTNAYNFSDKVLNNFNTLINYNTLKIGTANPFPSFAKGNPEVIYYSQTYGLIATLVGSSGKGRIDTSLIKTYEQSDLRKSNLFTADGTTGLFKFKGSYTDNGYEFNGIATDEIYLIHAECLARNGNLTGALSDLNNLLKNRYLTSGFQSYNTTDQNTLLARVLLERRKEMPFTGNIRWEDLRRLNQDPNFSITLSRISNGVNYSLAANANRYIFPIPDQEVQEEQLTQNPR